MGVSSTTNRLKYSGDGVSTSFSFPYYFFSISDLEVYKYDTLLGGITQLTLGVNYTISGTPNFQGIYSSGANVVLTVAPLTTDIISITRAPVQTQTYSLLQNGIVSSTALVQQMDYLTLLVQRLQDEVSRCVQIPDGLGATFSGVLPNNTALNPLSFLQVNAGGNGVQLVQTTITWNKISIPYAALQTAALTNSAVVFTLPALGLITGLVVKHTAAFAGSGITTLYASVGIPGVSGYFLSGFDLLQTVADTAYASVAAGYIGSFVNPTNIGLSVTATGANLSALTQGSVDIYYKFDNI